MLYRHVGAMARQLSNIHKVQLCMGPRIMPWVSFFKSSFYGGRGEGKEEELAGGLVPRVTYCSLDFHLSLIWMVFLVENCIRKTSLNHPPPPTPPLLSQPPCGGTKRHTTFTALSLEMREA